MVGLFIGSFNPPTLAHLKICLELKNKFSKIIFIPVNSKNKDLLSMYHRINMLNIYKRKYPFLEVDNIMKSYSYFDYRILDLLKKKYHEIKIIIGDDILLQFDKFDNRDYLLNNYNFVVVKRDTDKDNLIIDKYHKYNDHFEIYDYCSNISSTMARNLIKNNNDTKNILDEEIKNYIRNNHLYV